MPGFYKPDPNETNAYHKDAGGDEYFGWASSGTLTSKSNWQIIKQTYTVDNWIMLYPRINATSFYSDQPIFEWDEVESYDYGILGT